MKLTIEANTIEELMEKVCKIADKFNVDLSENTKTPVTKEVVKAAEEVTVEVVKEKKTKKGEKLAEAVVAEIEQKAIEAEVSKAFTKQDITDACQEVSEKHGLPKAREILEKFGAKRISEVKEADFGAFIEACKAAL